MRKIRLSFDVSPDVNRLLQELAEQEGTTKADIVRRGVAVVKAFRQQRKEGYKHLGFTADRNKLDAEMLGVLDN